VTLPTDKLQHAAACALCALADAGLLRLVVHHVLPRAA